MNDLVGSVPAGVPGRRFDDRQPLHPVGAAVRVRVYRFHKRDANLVLGPPRDGKHVQVRVTIDGAPPGDGHGADTDPDGRTAVTERRLYPFVRATSATGDHAFEIRFLDPGVQAYAFTFG